VPADDNVACPVFEHRPMIVPRHHLTQFLTPVIHGGTTLRWSGLFHGLQTTGGPQKEECDMTRLLILSAGLFACAAFLPSTASAESIACAAQVPTPPKGHWYYRIIDAVAEADAPKPVLASDAPQATTDGRNIARQPAAEPAAAQTPDPEVWPAPVVDEGSFESRWRALQSGR
jgi:hypothetical protein